MNRRRFLSVSGLGLGALYLPFKLKAAPLAPPPITWKDFDWTTMPCGLATRIEEDPQGKWHLTSMPYCVKTTMLQYDSPADVDWAKEMEEVELCLMYRDFDGIKAKVHTNEILLTGARALGYTHLYAFVSMMYVKDDLTPARRCYAVRGAKLPNWKSEAGRLKVVERGSPQ